MIKAEIKKNGNLYVFDLTNQLTLEGAYTFAEKIAQGKEAYEDQQQIVDLGTSKDYDHIRVYVESDVQGFPAVEEPVEDDQLQFDLNGGDYMKGFEDRITYLGQDLKLKGIKAVDEGVPYVLIYEINDQPAQLTISGQGLGKLTQYQGQVLGYNNPIGVVAAADLLDEEAALEYLEDYIKEIKEESRQQLANYEKSATAYFGFNDNGDPKL